MSLPSPSSFIKPDPDLTQDQDDLLLSYLNADCVSTDAANWPALGDDHPSPPYSTSSTDSPKNEITVDMNAVTSPANAVLDDEYTQWLANAMLPQPFPQDLFTNFPLCQQQNFVPYLDPVPLAAPAHSSDSSDSEHSRKKRGRKRRDSQTRLAPTPAAIAPAPPKPATLLVPAPYNKMTALPTGTPLIKPQTTPPPCSKPIDTYPEGKIATSHETSIDSYAATTNDPIPQDQQKVAAQISKRQERLIKNRAAALLSRKRKREHLNALEEQKEALSKENEQLKSRVAILEAQVNALNQENHDLRRRLGERSERINISPKATGGFVFMIILFSFALFSLPSHTGDRLTVGGAPKQLAIMGSPSTADLTYYRGGDSCHPNCQPVVLNEIPPPRPSIDTPTVKESTTTDLVLIDPIRPHALQSWIEEKLRYAAHAAAKEGSAENGLVHWSSAVTASDEDTPRRPHIYLYSSEFSQVVPALNASISNSQKIAAHEQPLLSLIAPFHDPMADCPPGGQQYLQINVQVLGSRVIDGQLLAIDQCPFATSLLHNLKGDLLCDTLSKMRGNNTDITTPALPSKRESKSARRRLVGKDKAKKIARVIV